jgi:hypothetical protein
MRWRSQPTAGIDEAVLAELRAIRAEIHDLSERVATAATRDDLHDYVSADLFTTHLEAHRTHAEGWRVWLPFTLSATAFIWSLLWSLLGQHLALR